MNIADVCEDIRSMKVRGAANIAVAAAQALADFSKSYNGPGKDASGFYHDLSEAARQLLGTRPTAVSLHNAIFYIMTKIDKDRLSSMSRSEVRDRVVAVSEQFIRASNEAKARIAEIGAKLITDGDVIHTHCNSSVALGIFFKAHAAGKSFRVISSESRPRFQGRITVKQLAEKGIPVTMIVDSAVHHFMPKVDKVFVGADSINSIGEVYNKIGTSQVALIAYEANRPFYVCAETYKFAARTLTGDDIEIEERAMTEVADPKEFPGVEIKNPAFDITPPKHITGIITEMGIIPATGAFNIVQQLYGLGRLEL